MATRKRRPSLTHAELAAELAGDADEYRMELQVDQVAPRFRVPSAAFLVIRLDVEAEVTAAIEAMSDALRGALHVRDAAALTGGGERAWYAGLPAAGAVVEVGHHSDRSYAGYGNLYRAIGALARWLEDGRFFVSEDYSSWVDEYRIAGGAATVTRGFAADEFRDDKRTYYVELARSRADDGELRTFAAWELAIAAGYGIPDREGAKPEAARFKGAGKSLAIAAELAPDDPEVSFQRGRHARVTGDHAAAARYFAATDAAADPKHTHVRTTMAATAIAAGDLALARGLLDRAGDDRCTWILRGHVTGDLAAAAHAALACTALGDREAIPWTGDGGAILDGYAGAVSALVRTGEVTVEPAARELLAWAELYRIRTAHGLYKKTSRPIADALYAQAASIDALGGDIAAHRVFHQKGIQGAGAVKGLTKVLADFPDNPEALFWTASGLSKRGEYAEALELWRRYDRVSATRSSYERGTAQAFLADGLVRVAYQRMTSGELGADTEQLLDEAIAMDRDDWVGPFVGKGDLCEYRRDHATALGHYDRAVEVDPSSAHAWSGRGSCLNNLGRYAEAIECFDKAAAYDATYWHVPYARACTLAKMGGDRAEIRALVKQALALEPSRRAQILGEPDLAAIAADLVDL